MDEPIGLRERKKHVTRHRLGDVAARLFAEHGYDAVSMSDVARAAGVAEQTVYNYFATKPELVLDRADEILERSRRAVAERDPARSPGDVVRELIHEDIDRYVGADPTLARGEFPAQVVLSPSLRRYALEFRDTQTEAIASAICQTDPELRPLSVRAHAAGLVAVIHFTTEQIGAAVLEGRSDRRVAGRLRKTVDLALDDADRSFRCLGTDAPEHAPSVATSTPPGT